MTIQLLKDRVLVKPSQVEQTNSFGIILPDNHQNKDQGVVVAIGEKVVEIKVGDTIRKFKAVTGIPYSEDGIDYLILSESNDIELIL
jgi:co-chaperonin GroES (HSP10)